MSSHNQGHTARQRLERIAAKMIVPDAAEREHKLRAALMEFVRVEANFGHTGQHKPEECADCKRVQLAYEALSHGYLLSAPPKD